MLNINFSNLILFKFILKFLSPAKIKVAWTGFPCHCHITHLEKQMAFQITLSSFLQWCNVVWKLNLKKVLPYFFHFYDTYPLSSMQLKSNNIDKWVQPKKIKWRWIRSNLNKNDLNWSTRNYTQSKSLFLTIWTLKNLNYSIW